MRRLLKWFGIVVGIIACVALIGTVYVLLAAGNIIDRKHPLPPTSFVFDRGTADIGEGERLAALYGCFNGCHGDGVGGNVFNDDFAFGRIVAPDLSRSFAEMSEREIDLAVRHGIRRDGRSMMVMPSASFHHLTDQALNDITAFIRSHAPGDGPSLEMKIGPVAKFFIWKGLFRPQAEEVRDGAPWIAAGDLASAHARGKYLAVTVCGECHGNDLRGREDFTPSLAIAVAYSREEFGRLLREGVPIGDRELDLMAEVATKRLVHLTDAEVDALYAYLRTLASDGS